jgi:YHS domain-containing protein
LIQPSPEDKEGLIVVKKCFVHGVAWGVVLFVAGAWAVAADEPVVVPCPGGCRCIPNAKAFGYFPTRWREWPGEVRPDKAFPQVIGKELLPTPPGKELLPPPKEVIAPMPVAPPLPPGGPPSPTPAPGAPVPAIPLEPNPPLPQTPSSHDTLPAMPLEPTGPVPTLPSMEQGLPGLQSKPSDRPSSPAGTEKKPAESDKDRQKQSQARPDAKTGQALRLELGARLGTDLKVGRTTNPPGETYISSPTPWVPPAPLPPRSGVTRADWQAEASNSTLPRAAVAPMRSDSQQVAYQDLRASLRKPQATRPQIRLPANLPPGLNGYCPVELVENENWVPGDPRWTATYQGRSYVLSGPEQHLRFVTNPSRYCPVLSGMDPVLAVDENRELVGQTEYCVVYDGRLYMFSGEYSLARFRQNPKRYAAAALQPSAF